MVLICEVLNFIKSWCWNLSSQHQFRDIEPQSYFIVCILDTPFSHLLTFTLLGSIFSQYHASSLRLQLNPLSHIASSFSRGSLLHASPMSLRHTSQQPHLSFTTAVLQLLTKGHAYLGSGQSPALLHQHAGQSGIAVGFRRELMNDTDTKSKMVSVTVKSFIVAVN